MVDLFRHALMIAGFVFVMMLVIEYFNVQTSGVWQKRLSSSRFWQYVVAALLGLLPGCLGSFTAVAMCSHRMMTIGAVVTAMIVTSGDEAFVMLAMIPKQALVLWAVMFFLGIAAGIITDLLFSKQFSGIRFECGGFEIHHEERSRSYTKTEIYRQWKNCSLARGVLTGTLVFFVLAVISGQLAVHDHADDQDFFSVFEFHTESISGQQSEHPEPDQSHNTSAAHESSRWNWMQITLLVVSLIALLIVALVPDHFLDVHLWEHVFLKHIPHVFLWTFGTILAVHLLTENFYPGQAFQQSRWMFLIIACLVGLIPESGPHYVFVILYAQGVIPFSILLASSIVQDGHGMLPMLAASRRVFIIVKAINFTVGLLAGGIVLVMGF